MSFLRRLFTRNEDKFTSKKDKRTDVDVKIDIIYRRLDGIQKKLDTIWLDYSRRVAPIKLIYPEEPEKNYVKQKRRYTKRAKKD